MGIKEEIIYWRASANRDWKTAQYLFKGKRYDGCLFFCHLALEKTLKYLVSEKTKQPVPYTHDLAKLANLAGLKPTKEQTEQLRIINTFNIAGRYQEKKKGLYRQATKAFSEKHLNEARVLRLWLKKESQKR